MILITGNGTAGSWHCRGAQIGEVLEATVAPHATLGDFKAASLVLVVKRVTDERLAALRAAGTPWVLDVVDGYPQPMANEWDEFEAVDWFRRRLAYLKPDGVIWPNKRMGEDVGFKGPQAVIYHHHRPGIRSNPIRKHVECIGYEGSSRYIEPWRGHIDAECSKRGWRFVLNPSSLSDMDIVLALRGGRWNGYVSQHWKSNVKLANAHGSGTPFVGSPENGYTETASGAEYWATNLASLRMSFDFLTDQSSREAVSDRFRQRAYSVTQAAQDYREFLCAAKFS